MYLYANSIIIVNSRGNKSLVCNIFCYFAFRRLLNIGVQYVHFGDGYLEFVLT